MTEIPAEAFDEIIKELKRQPIATNKYRTKAGSGQSQTFGIVNRRCLPPDFSRQNWLRPMLYHMLLEFAQKYVTIPFNSITINQNYRASAHRDKNNVGDSFLVAFGRYNGGDLKILEGDLSGNHNVWCKPIITDFSKVLHEVDYFMGDRYSLVFYTFQSKRSIPLPDWELRYEQEKWWFYRDGVKITKDRGLPHPLRKTDSKMTIVKKDVIIEFE